MDLSGVGFKAETVVKGNLAHYGVMCAFAS